MRIGPAPGILLGLTLVAVPGAATASATSSDCLECHGDADLKAESGRSVHVEPKAFRASVHGGAECVDCHADLAAVDDYPHAAKLEPVTCGSCHEEQDELYARSAHAVSRHRGFAASCVDCHGSHDIRPVKDPQSRVEHFRLSGTCGRCHGDVKVIEGAHIRIGNTYASFKDSIHGKAVDKSGLTVAPDCSDCHRAHDILPSSDPDSPVSHRNVPRTCGRCHQGIVKLFEQNIHGAVLEQGDERAPVCIDCHSAHHIRRVDFAGWRLDVIRECGTCHEKFIHSYRDTFHGQVTALGFERVATCADCHGSHQIFRKEDPRSMISAERRAATCRKCHPGANENFAAYDPHVDPDDRDRNPLVYYTALFMKGLLICVFSFFGLHTALWLLRGLYEKTRVTS